MIDKDCEKCGILLLGVLPFQKYCANCKVIAGKERARKHYLEHKENYNERAKIYHKENSDKIKEQKKMYRQENIEVIREKDRIRRNGVEKERRKAYKKNYNSKNKKAILQKEAERYQLKKDFIKAYTREYNKNNPDKVREWSRAKRVRKRNAFGFHSVVEFYDLCESFDWECAYCGVGLKKTTATVDHFIPISKGGSDLIENVVPSCRSCNSSKQAQDFFEWYKNKDFYSLEKEIRILKRNGEKPQLTLF